MAIILVLENPSNLADLKSALQPRGHELVEAADIENGMDILSTQAIDLVVCGVHLLYECVFDFLKLVRTSSNQRIAELPFVFYCAQPDLIALFMQETNERASVILGASKYILMKTFDPHRLALEIELCLPGFAAHDAGCKQINDVFTVMPILRPDNSVGSHTQA